METDGGRVNMGTVNETMWLVVVVLFLLCPLPTMQSL